MVILNHITGRVQVFSSDAPDLGYAPLAALSELTEHYKEQGVPPARQVQLKSTFDIRGDMLETEFPYVVQAGSLYSLHKEATSTSSKPDKTNHYFGGIMILDGIGQVKMALSGCYSFYRSQSLTVGFVPEIEITDGLVNTCDVNPNFFPVVDVSKILEELRVNHYNYVTGKKDLQSLGLRKAGKSEYYVGKSGIDFHVAYKQPGRSIQVIDLRIEDIHGMRQLRKI